MRFASFPLRTSKPSLLRWLALFCVGYSLFTSPVYAQPTISITSAVPTACEDGAQGSGATYRICMPAQWNNKLLVYAHGYVAPNQPVGIPEDQMKLPGTTTSVDQLVNSLGYAFATSGYRRNGLAVREAVDDLIDVVKIFKEKNGTPTQVLLVGISEGGLITTLAVEQHADVFSGGLAMCGPYGSFREQTNYFGDFRVLFDAFFPNLLPPSPVDVPADLLNGWESSVYSTTIKPVVTNPDNAAKLQELLTTANAASDPNDSATQEQTVNRVLWYNIFATNDAKTQLGGQPFDNQQRTYSGSDNDTQLNQNVQRFGADQAALDAMQTSYETSGKLTIPLVTLHTTDDPVVPASQAHLYRLKTIVADNLALHENITVARYGHCQFNQFEILNAFNTLTTMVDNPPAYKPAQHLFLPTIRR